MNNKDADQTAWMESAQSDLRLSRSYWLNAGLILCGFCLEMFPLPVGAWDGQRYFIVALPEPSINYFTRINEANLFHTMSAEVSDALYLIEY